MFKSKAKKLALLLLIVIAPTLLALGSMVLWLISGPYAVISVGFFVVEAWAGSVLFSLFSLVGYAVYRYLTPSSSKY